MSALAMTRALLSLLQILYWRRVVPPGDKMMEHHEP